jgi:hypothetical protein
LFDQIENVIVNVSGGCASAAVEIEWEVDIHYVPFTLTWVTTILSGVPVGTHIDWLSCNSTGTPPARTRVAAVTNCAVAQGGTVVPVNAQPAIAY